METRVGTNGFAQEGIACDQRARSTTSRSKVLAKAIENVDSVNINQVGGVDGENGGKNWSVGCESGRIDRQSIYLVADEVDGVPLTELHYCLQSRWSIAATYKVCISVLLTNDTTLTKWIMRINN